MATFDVFCKDSPALLNGLFADFARLLKADPVFVQADAAAPNGELSIARVLDVDFHRLVESFSAIAVDETLPSAGVGQSTPQHPVLSATLSKKTRAACQAWAKELLVGSGAEQATYLLENAHRLKAHVVGVHVDYYPGRVAWVEPVMHKDSVGATLFVLLHYFDVGVDMIAAEFVHHNRVTAAAPSALDRDNWPSWLLQDVDEARRRNEERAQRDESFREDVVHYDVVERGGVLGFTDELVFHSSPYLRNRGAQAGSAQSKPGNPDVYKKPSVPGKVSGDFQPPLTRRLSADWSKRPNLGKKGIVWKTTRYGESLRERFEPGEKEPRKLMRIWVTVTPRNP